MNLLNKCKYCMLEDNEDLSHSKVLFVWVDDNVLTVEYDGTDDLQFVGAGVNININYCPMCGREL